MDRPVKADESVNYVLSCAVAEVEGFGTTDLPPRHDTLDVDALDTLFSSETDSPSRFQGSLEIDYSDSVVSIESERSVTISNSV